MSLDAILTREQAQAIVEKAVKRSKADAQLGIQSAFGPKHAVVTTNDLSDDAIQRAVELSERLAKLAPDDPEAMPQLGAQQYAPANAWFDAAANLTADDRANAALIALKMARTAGDVKAAGYLVTGAGALAIGNSTGMFADRRNTSANYTLTVRTNDGTGSGWAAADHPDWRQRDARR